MLIAVPLAVSALLFVACMVDRADSTPPGAPPQPDAHPPNAARPQLTATPTVLPVGSGLHGPPAPRAARVAVPVADLVRQYLAEAYGRPGSKSSWYDNIRSVAVRFNTAVVRTDLSSAPNDQRKAETICQAVSWFPSTAGGRDLGGLSVEVYGHDDQLLATRRRVDTPASASVRPGARP